MRAGWSILMAPQPCACRKSTRRRCPSEVGRMPCTCYCMSITMKRVIQIGIIAVLLVLSPVHSCAKMSDDPSSTDPFALGFTGPEETVISNGQWGLNWLPDENISFIKSGGNVHVWFAARKESYLSSRPLRLKVCSLIKWMLTEMLCLCSCQAVPTLIGIMLVQRLSFAQQMVRTC